jgi:hypothetical protein
MAVSDLHLDESFWPAVWSGQAQPSAPAPPMQEPAVSRFRRQVVDEEAEQLDFFVLLERHFPAPVPLEIPQSPTVEMEMEPEPLPLEPQPRKPGQKGQDHWAYSWLEEDGASAPMAMEEVFSQTGEADPEAPRRHPAFILLTRLLREEKIMRRWGVGIMGAAAALAFSPIVSTTGAVARATASPPLAGETEEPALMDLNPPVEVLRRFLAASLVEEKYALVRPGPGVLERMQEFYRRHPDEGPEFVLQSAEPGHTGPDFCLLRGMDGMGKPLDVLVEKTSAGYLIDWRFLTGSGDMDWADWLASRPEFPVVMRAEAFAGSYYAPPFTDAEKYVSVRLTDLRDQHTVWAYVERESPTGIDLALALAATPRLRITAELSFPPQPGPRHPVVLLRAVLPDGWKDTTLSIR